MITKWLHLEDRGGDPWILPIWTAANAAHKAGKVNSLTAELTELGLHVSTRLSILPLLELRLQDERAVLMKAVSSHQAIHVFTSENRGHAFRVDERLKYLLIADIDGYLFEVNSCTELLRELFRSLHDHAGRPIAKTHVTPALRETLTQSGVEAEWFGILDRERNFVAHTGTPYLAVDLSDDNAWDVLIMKKNLIAFDATDTFFRFSDLLSIASGFSQAKSALRQHLIGLFC